MRSSALPTLIYSVLKRPFFKAYHAFIISISLIYPNILWVETTSQYLKQTSLFHLYWVLLYAHWVDFSFFFALLSSLMLPNFAISSSNFASVT